jgi:hypothetical protein
MGTVDLVVNLAKSIRIDLARMESDIVSLFSYKLEDVGISHYREVRILPRCFVDILTEDGVAIEFKRGKPNTKKVAEQIERYSKSDMVKFIVLVTERGLRNHIIEANGKRVEYVALSFNWGITV